MNTIYKIYVGACIRNEMRWKAYIYSKDDATIYLKITGKWTITESVPDGIVSAKPQVPYAVFVW